MKKFIAIIMLFVFSITTVNALSDKDIEETANGILDWIKTDDYLLEDDFLENAGTTQGDWYVVSLNKLQKEDYYSDYLEALEEYVEEKYKTKDKLDKNKATEWHRIILAVLACNGNPESFTDSQINLVADGIYNRENLSKQGINGAIWGLIALDSGNFKVPENAVNTRESIIAEILSRQQKDGSWTIGGASDPDITAMALQSLAKYKSQKNVGTAIAKAKKYILKCKITTPETISQIIIAYNMLGEECSDYYNSLLEYKCSDGGFAHEKNGESDIITGQQVLLALSMYKNGGYTFNQVDNIDKSHSSFYLIFFMFSSIALIYGVIILNKKKGKVN